MLCSIPTAQAQTVSGSGNTSSMALGRLNTTILTLQQQLNAANSNIAKLQACQAQHMFYSPSDPKADGNGCTGEQDPQVNDLTSNGLCTSDGNVIDCKTMQGTDVKVFSVTQIASNHTTATATCPSGTLRVGCAGDRDYAGSCSVGTCGIDSITPVGVNGCQITAQGDNIVPAAVALCFSLNGGSDSVVGSPPSAPPKSCALPWGDSLASGQSVKAWQAASVPAGSTCVSQTRTCNNGSLSGSYANKTCTVQPSGCASQYIYWKEGCDATAPSLADGQSTNLNADDLECDPYPSIHIYGSVTVTCSGGTLTQSSAQCHTLVACFTAEVQITLADGTTKLMRNLRPGDKVRGEHGVNTVLRVPTYDDVDSLYGFNGSKPFVTGGHPFWTQAGWKAVDPSRTPAEGHNVKTAKLQVGDTLYLADGKTTPLQSIKRDGPPAVHHVYDPIVSGDHTYYANGYLVHNKWAGCATNRPGYPE